jgi:dipeptidyl aminopeptidase/acylaminoacyl peptidase
MPRKITMDDLWALETMGNVAVSPDGRRVAFVMHGTDKTKDETHDTIFLLHLDERGQAVGEPRRLTSGTKHDSNPVWAPDSRRLLFLSDREGEKNQLWLIESDGGEARKLTSMLHGVSDAAWSPDGRWIAFTAAAAPYDDDDVLMGRKILDEAAKKKYEEEERTRLRSVTTIFYRLDGRGIFEKFDQLFVMPAPASSADAVDPAAIRRLTAGEFDHVQPLWTPDSREVGVLCNRNESRHQGSFARDLWTIDHETGEARWLTEGTLEIGAYSWSPDGRMAVVVGSWDEVVHGSSIERLHLVTRAGNAEDRLLLLTPDLDNSTAPAVGGRFGFPGPYRPQWSEDGQQIYFLLTEHGSVHVYRMELDSRTITPLTTDETVTGFLALLPGDRSLFLAQARPDHPWEFYRLSLNAEGASEQQRLTRIYDSAVAELQWGKVERFSYQGANGDEIDGWLIHPVGEREGVRYPLMVQIHGGPHWAFGCQVDPFWHYFAAQGYAIFGCNPHGSTGQGEEFMRSVIADWGGKDYQDIMRGVDECIARGVADPERLVVTGYSYGGYMSMYIIGQTNRFKAAAPMAGISNLASSALICDICRSDISEAQGYPWDEERASYYRECSPLTYAPRVTTPTLLIRGENDLRCPIEQSEQLYMALKMIGKVPVEFVRVPGAWHAGRVKPGQWMAYWEKMLDWFSKYIEIRPEEYSQIV